MGRNSWRRITLYRGSRKGKSLLLGMGHAGKGNAMKLADDEINHEIVPEKMDGVEDTLTSSKDIIFRDSGGKKTDITEAENCCPTISSKNLSPALSEIERQRFR